MGKIVNPELPKLLTLLDFVPESPHGGAVIVRELALRYPPERFNIFACTTDVPYRALVGFKRKVFRLSRRPGRWGLYRVRDFVNWHLGLPLATRSLERFFFQNQFDKVGKSLSSAQEAFDTAQKHLKSYRGKVSVLSGQEQLELDSPLKDSALKDDQGDLPLLGKASA